MLIDFSPTLMRAEQDAATGDVTLVLRQLRRLSIRDFADLMWQLPLAEYPQLSRLLPRMASDEIQRSWTGASGGQMMLGSVDFIRIVQTHFERLSRRPLQGTRIMDYGCGYGRLGRLMYWFTDPEYYCGVDPWDKSLEICREYGMLGHLVQSDYLPETLPVGGQLFDMILAYSVFTHTSLRATTAALRALRDCIHSSGLLIITIRPVDYWFAVGALSAEQQQQQVTLHQREGFAYRPGQFPIINGEAVFGETSMSPEWIERNFPYWRVEAYDRGQDGWQKVLMLRPV